MRKGKLFLMFILLMIVMFFLAIGCSKVPAGHVGVKVYLLGTDKGVDHEELDVGRYWIGWNEELYLFPTFTQNYVWTKNPAEGSPEDESITFQTKEGLEVNGDFGISYHIEKDKVSLIFQKYRRGIEEITDVFLRNMVRDALNEVGSKHTVEYIYGEGKAALMDSVESIVRAQVEPIGIVIEKIYVIGSFRLPETVVDALNAKIEAKQRAEQRENELREAEAEAKKKVAAAEGEAKSMLIKAEAEAKALRLKNSAITPNLIKYEAIQKWDGKMPTYTGGGAVPFIDVK